MRKVIRALLLGAAGLVALSAAHASACGKTTIFFVNGISNEQLDAQASVARLMKAKDKGGEFADVGREFLLNYNTTGGATARPCWAWCATTASWRRTSWRRLLAVRLRPGKKMATCTS